MRDDAVCDVMWTVWWLIHASRGTLWGTLQIPRHPAPRPASCCHALKTLPPLDARQVIEYE
jgi:hypothetical protein